MHGREKREVRRAAARLQALGRVTVNPRDLARSDEERLRVSTQAVRNEDVYEAAADCPACTAARAQSHDETALCAEHLRRAMGV